MPRRAKTPDCVAPERLPYSSSVRAGDFLFISGQVPRDRRTNVVPEGICHQARVALENLGAVLKGAKVSYEDVVKVTVFLARLTDFRDMNQVYLRYFSGRLPARSTVIVSALGLEGNYLIEIEAVAYLGNRKRRISRTKGKL